MRRVALFLMYLFLLHMYGQRNSGVAMIWCEAGHETEGK